MQPQTFKLTLTGNPISANQMWRSSVAKNGKAFTYMPAEAKQQKEFWQLEAMKQWRKGSQKVLGADNLDVEIAFFFRDRLRRDIDNFIKVALDALTGIVWLDDSQIKKLTASKEVDKVEPRIEITIKN